MNTLGIDEAGRGCVIGPMVVAGVVLSKEKISKLESLGVKDSKQLSFSRREELASEIIQLVSAYQLVVLSPQEIDQTNLNELDLRAITGLVKKLTPQKVIFDVPTHPNGINYFIRSVRYRLGKMKVELVGENKADENYPIVGAASILAKQRRDAIIEELKKEYGDFGSGYMSDAKTQRFLEQCFAKNNSFPRIIRHKWSSVQKFLTKQERFF